jgi:ribosomal protein S27AE
MNVGRVIGIILIVVGVVGCLIGAVVVGGTYLSDHTRSIGGLVIGLALAVVLTAPLVAVGTFLLVRGQQEEAAMAEVKEQKKLLGMVRSQGRVNIPEAAVELDVSRDVVKDHVYDLVNKGLFTGYINWDDGELISVDAAKMDKTKCPNCGGQLELAGKGVVECPYCGSEIFLS